MVLYRNDQQLVCLELGIFNSQAYRDLYRYSVKSPMVDNDCPFLTVHALAQQASGAEASAISGAGGFHSAKL